MPVPEMYDVHEPVSPQTLDALEKRLGITLPSQYRAWLIRHNGGRPSLNVFDCKDETGIYTDGCVSWFLAVYDGRASNFESRFLNLKRHPNGKRLPDELVPIADEMSGNVVCIAVSGPNLGKVYFWDHEEETVPPSYANCHLVAESFDEFIQGLYEI